MDGKWRLNGFYLAAQKKRWLNEMSYRTSCRKFSGPPSIGPWTALSYAASRCCMPGVRIVLGACDERFFSPGILPVSWITGVTRFAAVIVDDRDLLSRIHAGISGEAFVLEASAQEIGTCWVGGTYRKKECPVPLEAWENVACVIALGTPEKLADRETLPSRKRKSLERICTNNLDGWPEWAKNAGEAMRIAPSALNQQPWQLEYIGGNLSLWGAEKNAIDLGIALLHIEASITQPHFWTLGQGRPGPVAWVKLQPAKR